MQISPVLIYLFFFGSGFAALLYQVVWLKYLNLLFGSTTYATAAVIAAFMFGLSFGSKVSVRIPKLFNASLKTYGLIEIGIGLFAVTFPYLYSGLKIPFAWIFNLIGPQTSVYNLLTFLVAFLVLLVPTSLMGATLPLLSHYLIRDQNISIQSGRIYAINTAGAVAGVTFSAFLLIPYLGLTSTVYFGVLLNTVIGAICYFSGQKATSTPLPAEARGVKVANKSGMLWMYGISGMLAISYEVLWTRLLVLHLGNSVYAYAIMLAVFLIGISLGSYYAGKWIQKSERSLHLVFSFIQIVWAFSILLQVLQFAGFSFTLVKLAEAFGGVTAVTQFLILLLGAIQLLLLPTFLSGSLFPVVVTHLWKNGLSIQHSVAQSYSYNTIGGILGSLLAGFVLLPLFGTQTSILILASGNLLLGLAAILSLRRDGSSPQFAWIGIAAAVFAVGFFLLHRNVNVIRSAKIFQSDAGNQLLHLEEDPTATISVERRTQFGQPYRSLSVNGVNVAGTSPDLIAIQKMQAHIPVLLFGPTKAKHILHIGFGSGGTAYSASLHPNTKITVVEIARGVVRNAHAYFQDVNHGIVESPSLEMIYFDGRSYLQNTTKTYDIILSDSIHPRFSGNGSLYTKDYYELVYARLNPGGVHSQWIPIYSVAQRNLQQILKAFEEVFDAPAVWYINSTINAYIVITGRKGAGGIDLENFRTAFQLPKIAADLESISTHSELAVLDHFLFGEGGLKKYTQDVEPHSDDRLSVEYESSRIIHRQLSWWFNFRDLIQFREPVYDYLTSPSDLNRVNYDRFYQATRMNLIGQLYFVGGNREKAREAFADAARKNESDREPVEYYQRNF